MRTAIEALAAVLGGTQSLHTNCFDEALALPTEDAVRIALRTQQVIAHETGVVNTVDPLGGSLLRRAAHRTSSSARRTTTSSRSSELGGVVAAIKENFFQSEIAEASFRYQAEVEARQRIVVGVNRYELEDEAPIEILQDRSRTRGAADRARAGAPRPSRLTRRRGGARAAEGGRGPRRRNLMARSSTPRGCT